MKKILKKVIEDYTRIANEFAKTRTRAWPEFELFKKYLPKKNTKRIKILDVGCANGRLCEFLDPNEFDYTGIDNNSALLKIAKKMHPQCKFKKADMLSIPFAANSFDSVWCIAALHHLPSRALQKKALLQMKKVLKKNGGLMLTVWNLRQPKYKQFIDKTSHYSLIPWGNPPKAFRFYYAFTPSELAALLKEIGFSKLKKVGTKPNIAYICTK